MEVKDWNPAEKDSFTTPGGPFRLTTEGTAQKYEYDRASAPRRDEPVRPAPVSPATRTETAPAQEVSPFAPGAASPAWYEGVAAQTQAQEAPQEVVSHDGESRNGFQPQMQNTVPLQTNPGSPQVYTIQIPAAPRQPAPQKKSLWWLPLALIAALLFGVLIGILICPILTGMPGPTAVPPASTEAAPPQSTTPRNDETAASRVYRENVDAVVSISAGPSLVDGVSVTSVGTGFLISEDGYVLTNAHVVRGGGRVGVTLCDGRVLTARVVAMEEQRSDLALLKIEATGLHTVVLGDSDAAKVGDAVFTIGNPMGELSNSLSTGYLSARPREINTGSAVYTMLQTNAAINKGNSGGPLFDAEGRVIGVVTAKFSTGETDVALEGLGFALPINDVMALAKAWMGAARRDDAYFE